jgi:hypothetical protein
MPVLARPGMFAEGRRAAGERVMNIWGPESDVVSAGAPWARCRGSAATMFLPRQSVVGYPGGGRAGDNSYLLPVLDAIAIRGPAGGRPRKRPDLLLAE